MTIRWKKVVLESLLVLTAGLIPIMARECEYGYIAEDKAGEFDVKIDSLRMLQISYSDISLLSRWGEMWGSKYYGRRQKPGIYYFPNDILIKIKRGEKLTEYEWKHSMFERGYRQLNRVKVTPEGVVSDILIGFVSGGRTKKVVFYPAFFPEAGGSVIAGKKLELVRKDGTIFKKKYPEESKPIEWVEDDIREIRFPIGKNKVIKYVFSFSDPSTTLSLLAHTQYDTRCRAAMLGKLSFQPKGKNYTNVLHLEIKIDSYGKKGKLTPSQIDFGSGLKIEFKGGEAAQPYIFTPGEKIEFSGFIDNRWYDYPRQVIVNHKVRDYHNSVILNEKKRLRIPSSSTAEFEIVLPEPKKGIYSLLVEVIEADKIVGRKQIRFGVVPLPYSNISPEKSFFGSFAGPPKRADRKEAFRQLDILRKMGVKRAYLNPRQFRWAVVEKEPGKYVFDKYVDEYIDSCWQKGLFPESGPYATYVTKLPDWAKGTETYTWRKPWPYPKDMSLYEEFIYQLVKHLKGKGINHHTAMSECHRMEPSVYAKFLQAIYKGAKRADPDCVVMGAEPSSLGGFPWMRKVVEDEGGHKYLDMVTFHYYDFTQRYRVGPNSEPNYPERNNQWVDNIGKVEGLCDKYGFRTAITEIAWYTTYHGLFPHSEFQHYEREFLNCIMRAYLLTMTTKVEWITLCFTIPRLQATGPKRTRWMIENGYAGSFFDLGYNIRPWAIAHANLASLFDGALFKRRIPYTLKNVYCLLFERDDKPVAALWSVGGSVDARFEVASDQVRAVSAIGEEKKFRGRIKLELTGEPIYLVGKDISTAKLAGILEKGTFRPLMPIEIVDTIWDREKRVSLYVKNLYAKSVTIDNVRLFYNRQSIDKKKVEVAGNSLIRIPFEFRVLPKEVSKIQAEISLGGRQVRTEKEVSPPSVLPSMSVKQARSSNMLVAIRTKNKPVIDGVLKEWRETVPIRVDERSQVQLGPKEKASWEGASDLSCTGYLMWDEEYLYLAFDVEDNRYTNKSAGMGAWDGDSIQIIFDTFADSFTKLNNNDHSIIIALTKEGPFVGRGGYGNKLISPDGPIPGAKVMVRPRKGGMVYEAAIPMREFWPFHPEKGKVTKFNFVVFDDDGEGMSKCIGVTKGIAWGKSPALYKKMIFHDSLDVYK